MRRDRFADVHKQITFFDLQNFNFEFDTIMHNQIKQSQFCLIIIALGNHIYVILFESKAIDSIDQICVNSINWQTNETHLRVSI